MTTEGQPPYGWQVELDEMRAEGRPLDDMHDHVISQAKTLGVLTPGNRVEHGALVDTALSIMDEMNVEAKINPLAGLNSDLDRLAVYLDIAEGKYGVNPQDAMDRKQVLLDDAQRFLLGAQKRVLGLYEQHGVPLP